MWALVAVLVAVYLFDLTNGFHDASNAVAALVATGAARPLPAVVWAGCFNALGPLLSGAAVASTIGGVLSVPYSHVLPVVGAGLVAALVWNLATWVAGLPSSSSHALVGGLVGAGLVEGGFSAVRWAGMQHLRPQGVLAVLAALAISPPLGFAAGWLGERAIRRLLRPARRAVNTTIRRSEWVTSAALAYSHGANDAQKTIGVATLVLVATGHLSRFASPLWVKLLASGLMTIGTTLGGWRIVRTIGRGIYRLRPPEGLVSQVAASAVIFSAAVVGAPVSTTHVVASSVVGAGAGHRVRHVRWPVVAQILFAWLVTLPATALMGAALWPVWRALG